MSDIQLHGAVALVTGGNRGIGAAIARRLARAGAHVVVSARQLEAAQAVVAEIAITGGATEAVECDVTQYDQVAGAVEACVARHGRIDILINNAGAIEPIARLPCPPSFAATPRKRGARATLTRWLGRTSSVGTTTPATIGYRPFRQHRAL